MQNCFTSEDVFYVSGYAKLSDLSLPCGKGYFTPCPELGKENASRIL